MRKIYLLILFCFGLTNAQIVNIPDANFKNYLLNNTLINTNGDGEIQESEAAAQTFDLTVSGLNISSLEGVAAFSNIWILNCDNNNLTTLDVSMLPNLSHLECQNNQIANLDLSMNNIAWIGCNNNGMTSLLLSPNAGSIGCQDNQLQTLIIPGTVSSLNVSNNLLTSLSFSGGMGTSDGINLSNNPLTSLSISGGYEFADFSCNNTALTSIDLSNVANFRYGFSIANNPNLQSVNLRNGSMSHCTSTMGGECLSTIYIGNNPQLHNICVDYEEEATELNALFNNPAITYSLYCDLTPGGFFNTVTGNITMDNDSNGCDANDSPASNIRIRLNSATAGGANLGNGFADENGNFTLYPPVYANSYNSKLTPVLENPYFEINPPFYTTSFNGPGQQQTVDFCITPNGIHRDLEITFIPMDAARPGFNATYKVILTNKGTETQSGAVQLVFDDAVMDFVSAMPNLIASSIGLLTWDFDVLAPFQTTDMTVVFNINSPMETPAVNDGDILTFTANAISGTDETPDDNTFELLHTVVNSFDPNDKMVSETSFTDTDGYLYYTIRFQNTGTFAAENVVIKDYLSYYNLDRSTLYMVSSSHPFRSTLTNTSRLEFFFENINLPASIDNEPASHGYVTFKIKPSDNLGPNDLIQNTAEIYFDFNFPIVTNTVTSTFAPLATQTFTPSAWFTVYPNPAATVLNVKSDVKISSIDVINHIGQTVSTAKNVESIDVSLLASGVYFVRANSDRGTAVQKFIKL